MTRWKTKRAKDRKIETSNTHLNIDENNKEHKKTNRKRAYIFDSGRTGK